eukprot:4957230-Amphidinium_carterae.1
MAALLEKKMNPNQADNEALTSSGVHTRMDVALKFSRQETWLRELTQKPKRNRQQTVDIRHYFGAIV